MKQKYYIIKEDESCVVYKVKSWAGSGIRGKAKGKHFD